MKMKSPAVGADLRTQELEQVGCKIIAEHFAGDFVGLGLVKNAPAAAAGQGPGRDQGATRRGYPGRTCAAWACQITRSKYHEASIVTVFRPQKPEQDRIVQDAALGQRSIPISAASSDSIRF